MEQYINKVTVLAEIERRLKELYELLPDASKVENGAITISEACNTGKYTALESFEDYIDTIEVQEVDLEKEIDNFWDKNCRKVECGVKDIKLIGEHFFELGLKAQKGEEV